MLRHLAMEQASSPPSAAHLQLGSVPCRTHTTSHRPRHPPHQQQADGCHPHVPRAHDPHMQLAVVPLPEALHRLALRPAARLLRGQVGVAATGRRWIRANATWGRAGSWSSGKAKPQTCGTCSTQPTTHPHAQRAATPLASSPLALQIDDGPHAKRGHALRHKRIHHSQQRQVGGADLAVQHAGAHARALQARR